MILGTKRCSLFLASARFVGIVALSVSLTGYEKMANAQPLGVGINQHSIGVVQAKGSKTVDSIQATSISHPNVEVDPINWNIVLAGNVLTGVGVLSFLMMAGGLAARHDAQQRLPAVDSDSPLLCIQRRRDRLEKQEEVGSALAMSGGITAAVLVSTGLGLIFWGRAREKRRRDLALLGRDTKGSRWLPRTNFSMTKRRVHAMWQFRF